MTEDSTEIASGEGLISEETGDPRDPSGADPVEADLVEIAQQIYAIVDPTEGARNVTADGEDYGYAGLKIDPDRGVLTLYWVGELPPNIERIVSAPSSVTVVVVSASYTLFDLQDAARTLIESDPGAVLDGVRISLTGPRVQGDGIAVEYCTEGGGAVDADSVERAAEELVGLPVFADQVPGPVEELQTDQSSSVDDNYPREGQEYLTLDYYVVEYATAARDGVELPEKVSALEVYRGDFDDVDLVVQFVARTGDAVEVYELYETESLIAALSDTYETTSGPVLLRLTFSPMIAVRLGDGSWRAVPSPEETAGNAVPEAVTAALDGVGRTLIATGTRRPRS